MANVIGLAPVMGGRSEWLCWQKSLNLTPWFLGETEGHSWQDQEACYHGGALGSEKKEDPWL